MMCASFPEDCLTAPQVHHAGTAGIHLQQDMLNT